jgi:hypothetical protein
MNERILFQTGAVVLLGSVAGNSNGYVYYRVAPTP